MDSVIFPLWTTGATCNFLVPSVPTSGTCCFATKILSWAKINLPALQAKWWQICWRLVPGPPGWGLSMRLITPYCKTTLLSNTGTVNNLMEERWIPVLFLTKRVGTRVFSNIWNYRMQRFTCSCLTCTVCATGANVECQRSFFELDSLKCNFPAIG